MSDLVKSLLSAPFDRAEQWALTQINSSDTQLVERVKRLRRTAEEHFILYTTSPDRTYIASSITNQLHRSLRLYRLLLCPIWPVEQEATPEEPFFFPESAPLDWSWLVERFCAYYDFVSNLPPCKELLKFMVEGSLSRLFCQQFAKTCQQIAYEKVARSEDTLRRSFKEIELFFAVVAQEVLQQFWDHWQRPPYSSKLVKLGTYLSLLKLEKTKVDILGLPNHLSQLGLTKEAHLSMVEDQIKIGEATSSFLKAAITEEQYFIDQFGSNPTSVIENEKHKAESTKHQLGRINRHKQYRNDVAEYQSLEGKGTVEAIKAAAEKNSVSIDTIERALGHRK